METTMALRLQCFVLVFLLSIQPTVAVSFTFLDPKMLDMLNIQQDTTQQTVPTTPSTTAPPPASTTTSTVTTATTTATVKPAEKVTTEPPPVDTSPEPTTTSTTVRTTETTTPLAVPPTVVPTQVDISNLPNYSPIETKPLEALVQKTIPQSTITTRNELQSDPKVPVGDDILASITKSLSEGIESIKQIIDLKLHSIDGTFSNMNRLIQHTSEKIDKIGKEQLVEQSLLQTGRPQDNPNTLSTNSQDVNTLTQKSPAHQQPVQTLQPVKPAQPAQYQPTQATGSQQPPRTSQQSQTFEKPIPQQPVQIQNLKEPVSNQMPPQQQSQQQPQQQSRQQGQTISGTVNKQQIAQQQRQQQQQPPKAPPQSQPSTLPRQPATQQLYQQSLQQNRRPQLQENQQQQLQQSQQQQTFQETQPRFQSQQPPSLSSMIQQTLRQNQQQSLPQNQQQLLQQILNRRQQSSSSPITQTGLRQQEPLFKRGFQEQARASQNSKLQQLQRQSQMMTNVNRTQYQQVMNVRAQNRSPSSQRSSGVPAETRSYQSQKQFPFPQTDLSRFSMPSEAPKTQYVPALYRRPMFPPMNAAETMNNGARTYQSVERNPANRGGYSLQGNRNIPIMPPSLTGYQQPQFAPASQSLYRGIRVPSLPGMQVQAPGAFGAPSEVNPIVSQVMSMIQSNSTDPQKAEVLAELVADMAKTGNNKPGM